MAKTLLDLFRGSPHDTGVVVGSITPSEQDENGVKTLTIEDIGDFNTSTIEDTFNSSEHSSAVSADDVTSTEQDDNGVKTLDIQDPNQFETSKILDLFNSSDHSSDVIADDITSTEQDDNGVKTLGITDVGDFQPASLESIFSISNYNTDIKSDVKNLITQELTGIRIHSLVELNNPLLYGTDVPRISLRTTSTLNEIKSGTNAGLSPAMTALTKAAVTASTFLGMPVRALPTSIADAIDDPNGLLTSHPKLYASLLTKASNPTKIKELSATEIIGVFNNSGTDIGRSLRNSGGGTPAMAAMQAAGRLISLGKNKLRELTQLDNPEATAASPNLEEYLGFNIFEKPYSEGMASTAGRDYMNEGETVDKLGTSWKKYKGNKGDPKLGQYLGIDLTLVSPINGVKRSDNKYFQEKSNPDGKQYSNGFEFKAGDYKSHNYNKLPNYSPEEDANYSATFTDAKLGVDHTEKRETPSGTKTLEGGYGLKGYSDTKEDRYKDTLNTFSIDDTYTTKDLEDIDLIPFWIGRKDSEKKTHFRTLLTGITETVSPSWNSSNFFGNPFAYHTYTSIERSVTFSLQMYCSSELELQKMWERITTLTSYTYPKLDDERLIIPPIIDFRLGDIYNGKVGYLDSLSYTFPDNGTWEIDPDKGLLPKVVDVSITIKFIEQMGDIEDGSFYSYTLPEKQQTFSTNSQA